MAARQDKIIGVLGGGQLGRMLMESANRLCYRVHILDVDNAPAKQISNHDGHVIGSFNDPDSIRKLAEQCDVLTVEIEHVNAAILEEVASQVEVQPAPRTIQLIQNKFRQKKHLQDHHINVGPFIEVQENDEGCLRRVGDTFGYPFMLKSQNQAYDGRGNYPVNKEADIPAALEALRGRPLYAEKWQSFRMELAVMVVKTQDDVLSYPTVETVHEDSICKLVYAPARNVSRKLNEQAQRLARDAVATFPGKGVFGVEMFIVDTSSGTDVLVNEIAPRPHNSGHYTIEACGLSQYDAHLRAILDKPIPKESLEILRPAVMLNILGGSSVTSHIEVRDAALRVPNASIHLYGKGDARPGRKMGHVTVTARSMSAAEEAIHPLIELVNHIRASRTDVASRMQPLLEQVRPQPLVAVCMGSQSDRPVLEAGFEILKRFKIPFEKHVTSAHRTPRYMSQFAEEAEEKGFKVLIAAAGGAAHLPGMMAAQTSLPVIGIPVKGSTLDGMDSLLSIVQMPRGVPVATVGINNSTNAALEAARILGIEDERIRREVERYASEAADAAIGTDTAMQTE